MQSLRNLDTSKFRPLHDRVLVLMEARESTSVGGIIIPERAREQAMRGTVLRTGEDCEHVAEGAVVGVPHAAGTKIVVAGMECVIVREGQLLYVEE